jgi:hypothetical protein
MSQAEFAEFVKVLGGDLQEMLQFIKTDTKIAYSP